MYFFKRSRYIRLGFVTIVLYFGKYVSTLLVKYYSTMIGRIILFVFTDKAKFMNCIPL